MAYKTVTFTPTLSTDELALGDVLFALTEIQLPSRSAKLIGGMVLDYTNALLADGATLHFFQNNAAELGVLNETAGITEADFKLNRYQGSTVISTTTLESLVDNLKFRPLTSLGDTTISSSPDSKSLLPVVLTSTEPGYKIFVSGILTTLSTAPTLTADELEIVLYFEY